jgi:hypothetical protein
MQNVSTDTDQPVRTWAGIRWPVYRVELVTRPPAWWPFGPDEEPFSEGVSPATFLWVDPTIEERTAEDADTSPPTSVQRKIWPVAVPGRHRYNPVEEADALLSAATRVNVDDPASVTDFVNHWGLLGVGLAGECTAVPGRWDVLWATTEQLRLVQRFVGRLSALQASRRHGPDLPTIDEARSIVARVDSSTPSQVRPRDYGKVQWLAFAVDLEPYLRNVQPTIRWDDAKRQPVLAWRTDRPLYVLYAMIWDWATRGGSVRRCQYPPCSKFFYADRANKWHCCRGHTRYAKQREWRARLRDERARKVGRQGTGRHPAHTG